jgi:tetratricopeptide (TPR) repeat protein
MSRARWWLMVVPLLGCQATPAMPPAKPAPPPVVAKPVDTDAAEKHQRAVALSNEGDAAVKVNVEGAIAKYLEALQVEPDNIDVLWKLSRAQTKKEDWAAVASTLDQAVKLAPNVANYQRWRGHALVTLAQESEPPKRPGLYESAREPLTRCLKLDAKLADCAYLLAQVEEQAEHVQAAADLYLQAIANEPLLPRYYLGLAQWLRVFKQSLQAEMVLTEGLRQAAPKFRADLAYMAVLAADLAAQRHDPKTQLSWLEKAEAFADEETSPALTFALGSLYLELPDNGAVPSNKERAQRLLNMFSKRVCRGAAANKYRVQCEQTEGLLHQLTSPYVHATPPKPALPVVPLPPGMPSPKLALGTVRSGDAYTVWGASYYLRNPAHQRAVTEAPIAITGYVTKTNLMQAPRCVVHRGGVADPENCYAEIPAFWIGDTPDAAEADCIKVMGFASNYAQIFEAIRQADSNKADEPYSDSFWGQVVPNPLPVAGQKLTVRGSYGLSFAKVSSGAESDPIMGILDYAERDVLEPSPQLATLPGVKRKPRP